MAAQALLLVVREIMVILTITPMQILLLVKVVVLAVVDQVVSKIRTILIIHIIQLVAAAPEDTFYQEPAALEVLQLVTKISAPAVLVVAALTQVVRPLYLALQSLLVAVVVDGAHQVRAQLQMAQIIAPQHPVAPPDTLFSAMVMVLLGYQVIQQEYMEQYLDLQNF
jgi:hypothetical protein